MNNTNKDVLTKNVLTAALNDYLLHIQIDPLGDVTSQVNAAKALINYISTNDDITADLKQFENVVINLAVYDHSQAGENYMSALSEGGVSRTWKDRDKLFVGVFPFVKVL